MISRNAQRQQAVAPRQASNRTTWRVEQRAAQAVAPPGKAAMAEAARLLRSRRKAGLSLVELLISLAIIALLLTATMVAIDASFKAYAAAAESASAQSATRMVTNRLLTLVRTSTAHGPVQPSSSEAWPVAWMQILDASGNVTGTSTDTLESLYLEMIDQSGAKIRIEYHEGPTGGLGTLYIRHAPDAATAYGEAQPLLGGISSARFYTHIRHDSGGVIVLDRGTMDFEVMPDIDNTLAIESTNRQPIRVIASTAPRRLR